MAEHYTETVLAAVNELGREVTAAEIGHYLHIQTQRVHKKMLNVLSVLCISGRIARVRQGVYAPIRNQQPQTIELRQVMWRVLKMRRRVTVEDLQTMAGASYVYASDWLRMLEDKGVVRKVGIDGEHFAVWQLIATDAELPADDKEAARLRTYRSKKKEALAKMRSARTLINQAIAAMEEEEKG